MLNVTSLLVLFCLQIAVSYGYPEVELPDGVIRGREGTTIKGTRYYAFPKIPYAAPPIGDLRFQAPVPPEKWDEPLDMPTLDVSCFPNNLQSEDCLYLSVYTPELPSENNSVALPVMTYIHGGGFVGGTTLHSSNDPFLDEGVIYVELNYRLGPLGFLSTQDEVIPGNAGLKDQHLALKWVHDNIALFGGDPEKITIFGTSAGSASCTYHLLNKKSTGVLLESGTFLSPWAFQRNAREIAFRIGAFLNDTFETNRDSKELLEFLLTVDVHDLYDAQGKYSQFHPTIQNLEILEGFNFAPVIEVKNPTAFLTKKMFSLLKAGNVVPVTMFIGMASEEGLAFNQDRNSAKQNNEDWDEHLDWLVPDDMGITDETKKKEIGSKIREIYTGGEPFGDDLGAGVRYFSDTAFSRSIIKTAELYSQFADTYFYKLSYDGTISHLGVQYEGAEHVGHSQERAYVFCSGDACDKSFYPESDQITVKRVAKLWTNFAKYLNPTPEPSELLQNITWPLVSTDDGDFFYVDIDENLEIKNHPKEEAYAKWVEIYDSLDKDDFDTY